jgi:hypothetical protein
MLEDYLFCCFVSFSVVWMDGWGHKFLSFGWMEKIGVLNSFIWMDGKNWGSQILSFGWMEEIGGHKFFHFM